MGVIPPLEVSGKEYGEELYGFIKIVDDRGKLKIYTQWAFKVITDYTKGEDIVLAIPDDVEIVTDTLRGIEIIDAVVEDKAIVMYVKTKI